MSRDSLSDRRLISVVLNFHFWRAWAVPMPIDDPARDTSHLPGVAIFRDDALLLSDFVTAPTPTHTLLAFLSPFCAAHPLVTVSPSFTWTPPFPYTVQTAATPVT